MTITAHASADIDVLSLTLHRETDGQIGNSNDATKIYVQPTLTLGPDGVHIVGENHTFTAKSDRSHVVL